MSGLPLDCGPPEGPGAAPRPPPPAAARAGRRRNAMSVDVEDYFQVAAFAGHIERDDWERIEGRVEHNTDLVMRMFEDFGVQATFFTLGWVAERYPDLVRRIVAAGHELACHGFEHVRITEQSPDVFREDVRRTKRLLEDVGGAPVRGYRAASFSLGPTTLWAHEVLAEEGFAYSSSIYPIRHDLYGMPEAPRFAFRPRDARTIHEIPITSLRLLAHNFPCGGGGYFRLFPYALSRWALRRVNRVEGQPCVFFFHPWEIDPEQPRQRAVSIKSRVRHYTNLTRMQDKLRALLGDFAWDRIDRVFLADSNGGA